MDFQLRDSGKDGLGEWQDYLEAGSRYRVRVRAGYTRDHARRRICWLAITPVGDTPLHDWRDLQAIKNHFCGRECEAVEIYPPEADLVDANNNFHLWVYLDDYRHPFGFRGRIVNDPRLDPPAVARMTPQRPFDGPPPAGATDCIAAATRIVRGTPPFLPAAEAEQRVAEKDKAATRKKRKAR